MGYLVSLGSLRSLGVVFWCLLRAGAPVVPGFPVVYAVRRCGVAVLVSGWCLWGPQCPWSRYVGGVGAVKGLMSLGLCGPWAPWAPRDGGGCSE